MPPARVIDLTRSLRRAGRLPTGVDRVERAYLARFLADGVPLFALARSAFGYVLLDREGVQGFYKKLIGQVPWGAATGLSRLPRGRSGELQRAESDLRRLSRARCVPMRLAHMLGRYLPRDFEYYNLGHSNLTARVLAAVRQAGGQNNVMVHDVIPLDYPQYQRLETVEPFRARIKRVSAFADRILYNSHDTRQRTEHWMRTWGRVPPCVVAHLGADIPVPGPAILPPGLPPERPYFMAIGTIEPRKNHALLLDIWKTLGPEAPMLLICGNRGWNNDAVFARLDALPPDGVVKELGGLGDGEITALLAGAAGLLFPSFAEGYGLPPLEALSLGTPVLCNDLNVLREVLGCRAVYASVKDRYLWGKTISEWAENPQHRHKTRNFALPTWDDHFKLVLSCA